MKAYWVTWEGFDNLFFASTASKARAAAIAQAVEGLNLTWREALMQIKVRRAPEFDEHAKSSVSMEAR